MRILLVSGVYPPQIGGPSAQTQQLAQALIQRGIETQVVTFGETQREVRIKDVPVTFLDGSLRRGWGDKVYKNWRVYRQLCQIMRTFQPTIVHQQTAVANLAFYTGLAARRCGIPSLLKYSSDLIWERLNRSQGGGQSPLTRLWLIGQQRLLFELYDCLWVTTPAFQVRLQRDFQVPTQKIFLLPNFIDLSAFEQVSKTRTLPPHRQGEHLVLSVSRLQPWKGIDLCLKAIQQLQDIPLKLRIVGDGSSTYVAELKKLAQRLGVADRIEWLGRVPPNEIQAQYAQADVFVLASTYEPFGIVLVEAMAAGVPIVATRVDGIPAVVEDAALLFPPKDVTALAQALRTVLTDTQAQTRLREQGQKRAELFGMDVGCDRMIEQYQRL